MFATPCAFTRSCAQADERTDGLLRRLGLDGLHSALPARLSGGQRQRVALARTLALQPEIILFDEPMAALDAATRLTLREELLQLRREFSCTIVYVTHDQEEALTLSDRVMVMEGGRIRQIDTPENLLRRPADAYVREFVGENLLRRQKALERFPAVGGRMRKPPAALTAAAAALLVFFAVTFAYPLSRMLAQITPEGAAAVFSSTVFRRAVGSSCLSGGLTVLFALPLAMLMALLTESTRVRCRALWRGIFVLPMLLPSVSQGTGLVLLLGTNGLLTRGLCLPGSIYGLQGIVLGQVLYTAPIAYLLLANLLRYRSRSPYDAARLAGVPPLFRWSGITLPFLRKELLAAAFLVFSLSVTDYGIPLAVGGKVKTLASVMYSSVVGQLDFGRGCVIGLLLLIPALCSSVFGLLAPRRWVVSAARRPAEPPENPRRDRWALLLCALTALLFVLPVLAFTGTMFMEKYPVQTTLTLRHLREFWTPQVRAGLRNSVLLGLGTAAVGTALTAAAALVTARYANRAARWVHTLSVLLMAVPGLVLGLSFVLAFKGTALYGTVWILILAGVLHFFTTPYNLLYQSLQKLSSELESVGSTLGIPPLRLIFDVLLPQCAGTLADMAAYFFVSSTVTISAAAFLSTASTRPLALLMVQYSDQLNLSGAAYLSFLILAVNLLARAAAALVRRLVRR